MDHAIKELDSYSSDIFVYKDIKRFNKPVTVIQGLKEEKDLIKIVLRDLKKKLGTGGAYKNGMITLQGNHQEYVEKYLKDKNIITS